MRIAMIASSYPRYASDGSARFNHSIAEALARLGHDVQVVIPQSALIQPFETAVHIHPFTYIWPPNWAIMGYAQAMKSDRKLKAVVPLLSPLFFLFGILALWKVVRQENSEIIHAHWVIPNGFMAAIVSRLTGKPLYISLHGSDIFFARRNRWLAALAAWTFKRAQGVTACSPELYQGAVQLGAEERKCYLLPWGADPDQFKTDRTAVAALRKYWRLGSDTAIVLALGRLVGKKGFANLIQAYAEVHSQCPDSFLMIVGDGPEMDRLRQEAEQLKMTDPIIFTGHIDWKDVPNYLALADIFVVPSIHDHGNVDGLPTVILEAMAAGKAIIASDVGGISLAVKHGHTGLLVEEGNIRALAAALKQLLAAPETRVQYGRLSRALVEQKLNWHNVALSFEDMYRGESLRLAEPFEQPAGVNL